MLNDSRRFGGWYFLVCLSLFFNKILVFLQNNISIYKWNNRFVFALIRFYFFGFLFYFRSGAEPLSSRTVKGAFHHRSAALCSAASTELHFFLSAFTPLTRCFFAPPTRLDSDRHTDAHSSERVSFFPKKDSCVQFVFFELCVFVLCFHFSLKHLWTIKCCNCASHRTDGRDSLFRGRNDCTNV